MPPEILSLLKKENQLDLKLYDHALNIFKERAQKLQLENILVVQRLMESESSASSSGSGNGNGEGISGACKSLRAKYHMTMMDSVFATNTEISTLSSNKLHNLVFSSPPQAGGGVVAAPVKKIGEDSISKSISVPLFSYRNCSSHRYNSYCRLNMGCKCNIGNTPIRYLNSKSFEGKEFWGIVRNPVERALAQYKIWSSKVGSGAPTLEKYFESLFRTMERRPYIHDCHNIPQYEYIWLHDGRKAIHNVLKYEDLLTLSHVQSVFNISIQGRQYTRITVKNGTSSTTIDSSITDGNDLVLVDPMLYKQLSRFYWKDMCLFGYDLTAEPPSTSSLSSSQILLGSTGNNDNDIPAGITGDVVTTAAGSININGNNKRILSKYLSTEYINHNEYCGI